MARAPRTSGVSLSTVSRGARGVTRKLGTEQNFRPARVPRTIPGRSLGVGGYTYSLITGGRPSGFVGRIRAGATTSL